MPLPDLSADDLREGVDRLRTELDFFRGRPVPGRNWFEFRGPETTLRFHGQGLGDLMIIRQCGRAFQDYLAEHGDPGLGTVAIACGGYKAAFEPEPADVNCYWWWSFGPYDDRPGQYLDHYRDRTTVQPELVLCPSERCEREASQAGYDTLYLPLGTRAFRPLGLDREGLGYAGSRGHKDGWKEELLLDPFADEATFEFVSSFVAPAQLNLWYNTRLVTFGLTKEGQRRWGMVNNRVFETLASGTPFVVEAHPALEDVLGFEYPYQTDSRATTVDLVEEVRESPAEAVAEFREFAGRVREEHTYLRRVETLVGALA